MSQHARIVRASDLDDLPVGSIVVGALILDAPVPACKAQAGDWVLCVIWNPVEEAAVGERHDPPGGFIDRMPARPRPTRSQP